jgi:hypothetical protein
MALKENFIYSSLLRLVSELEQVQEKLEQDLFLTIHSVITQGNNHEQFDCDELTSSNYLSLDDFICFFLVPAVATCLILEDYPGFDNSHDTLFERSNNDEYGQLFFPEVGMVTGTGQPGGFPSRVSAGTGTGYNFSGPETRGYTTGLQIFDFLMEFKSFQGATSYKMYSQASVKLLIHSKVPII